MELKGKAVADFHKQALKEKLALLAEKQILITMAILVVGQDMASHMYAKFMKKTAEAMGFKADIVELPEHATQEEVEKAMADLSNNPQVHGILPMMPMPKHIDAEAVLEKLSPKKDLDGLTTHNIGLISAGKKGFAPCTPRACMAILDYYDIPIEGKSVVVLGRSNVVGKPVAQMLLNKNGTVTICHSKTKNLKELTCSADIIVAAIGKGNFLTADMVKEGSIIIDVGINEIEGKTVGDVDFEAVAPKVKAITPVPGGVGSVTTTMMLEALWEAYHA